ncbi:MAG: hypothetical protein ACR2GM_00105 [Nocardioidaceae bacterium]
MTRCAAEDGIVRYPVGRHDGVFAAAATRGKIGLLVRSPDQALVERILASVRAVGDDEALVRPDLVEVTPPDASPGELVELTYPRRTMRGRVRAGRAGRRHEGASLLPDRGPPVGGRGAGLVVRR